MIQIFVRIINSIFSNTTSKNVFTLSRMLLLIHLLSSIAVDYYRSIHPLTFLGSPFHQKVVVQIRSGTGTMTLSPGLTILIFFAAVSIILQACT